jgi:hypothetical protein
LTWIVKVALVMNRVLYSLSKASAVAAKTESVNNVVTAVFIVELTLAIRGNLILAFAISEEAGRVASGDCHSRWAGDHDVVDRF